MATDPEYLGDAVYASVEQGRIVITTDSHNLHEAGNIIFLEPEVFRALVNYHQRMIQQSKIEK